MEKRVEREDDSEREGVLRGRYIEKGRERREGIVREKEKEFFF